MTADPNSGFMTEEPAFAASSTTFSEIEIISQHDTRFTARASRYGRLWLLKGLKKEYADDARQRQQLMKEFEILSSLTHPGIVNFAGFEEVADYGRCIIMEWIEGPTLESALLNESLSKNERHRILADIVEAVAYIHSKGIVHRDLKPSNIMVRQNGKTPVIIDFGLADTDAYTVLKSPAGTQGYISERQQEAMTPYTGDDIYSLGVIMQSLYPEYATIARRCSGKASRRYGDASALSRAINRRDRLKIRLTSAIVAAALLAAIAWLGSINHTLQSSVDTLEGNLAAVTSSHQSTRQQFSDSIANLNDRLAKEKAFRDSIARHDALIAQYRQHLRDITEKAYAQWFKKSRPVPASDLDLMNERNRFSAFIVDKIMQFKSSLPDLTETDIMKIDMTVSEQLSTLIQRYDNRISQNERRNQSPATTR